MSNPQANAAPETKQFRMMGGAFHVNGKTHPRGSIVSLTKAQADGLKAQGKRDGIKYIGDPKAPWPPVPDAKRTAKRGAANIAPPRAADDFDFEDE